MKLNPFFKWMVNFSVVLLVSVCMLLTNIPVARADGDPIDIGSVSSGGEGYSYSGGVVTITSAGDYTVTGYAYSNTLAVADNVSGTVNITLSDVTISIYHMTRSPFVIGANDNVNLVLSVSNTLSGSKAYTYTNIAGITLPPSSCLTISGSGSLTAEGNGTGSGIGTTGSSGGTVTINSGTVTANGGYNDGGSGNSGIRGTVVINGGSVKATGGRGAIAGSGLGGTVTINGGTVIAKGENSSTGYGAAGIGGCSGESGGVITINGGSVTATGEQRGAGIGGGYYGTGGAITISGGTVVANAGSWGAGIGGGCNGAGGTIVITDQNGPTSVTARGSGGGAGIGCGYCADGTGATSVTIDGGTVVANGNDSIGGAGIGGSYFTTNTNCVVEIHGGDVTATGGQKAAGIGGAYEGCGGTITIGGGQVSATGGVQGAGIGSGYQDSTNGIITGGVVTITGGTVQATGGSNGGAGIGGGMNASAYTIAISGETTSVTATGTGGGAGIGGGQAQFSDMMNGNGGTITISGGTVTAAGKNGGAGIGGGGAGCAGSIIINGGLVTATADFTAAGIGSGRFSKYQKSKGSNDVTITGGRVYASGADGVPDIGGDNSYTYSTANTFNGGSIRVGSVSNPPSFGSTNVYKVVVSVINLDHSALADTDITYTVNGGASVSTATDDSGKLYLWLPQTSDGNTTAIEIQHGDAWYAASGAVTSDNAATMDANQLSYQISEITSPTFASLIEGYADGSPDTATVQFTNTGTGTLTNLTVSLDSAGKAGFNLGTLSAVTLAPGQSASFTLNAKNTLSAGEHKAKVTISADRMTDVHFQVSQTVLKEYSIAYSLGGGTNDAANPAKYTVESNEITLKSPVKTGYAFAGWSGAGIEGNSADVTIPTGSTGDRTYTAHWTAHTYAVQYEANVGDGTMAPGSFTYDVSAPLATNAFTRSCYYFAGWATSKSGPLVYTDGQTVLNLSDEDGATVELYAVWTAQPPSACLSGITLSAGSLSRAFDPNVTSYTVNLGELDEDVTVTPLKAFDGAAMTINRKAQPFIKLPVANGKSAVVTVKLACGKLSKIYTLTIKRPKSTENRLATLTVSSITFSFDPSVTTYNVTVPEGVSKVTVAATRVSTLATITNAKKTYTLRNNQQIKATVKVKAQSGAQKTYTIYITRAASTNATPAYIKTGSRQCPLTPAFSTGTTGYNVTLPANVSSVTISCKAANALAVVKIDGTKRTSMTVKLARGQSVTVEVVFVAQAGNTSQTYEITISRN